MRRILHRCRQLLGSEEGPTTVEYAVVLALILLIALSGARTLGCSMQASMTTTANELSN